MENSKNIEEEKLTLFDFNTFIAYPLLKMIHTPF